jgi:hypothetical protein
MGMGKSGGSTTVVPMLSPEQNKLISEQTKFLTGTAFPAYQATVGGAGETYGQVSPAVTQAAQTALDVTGRTGALQEATGAGSLGFGTTALASLFSPEYKAQQIQAAIQPAQEAVRDELTASRIGFGGAGGLGSTRELLARQNLASLGERRLGTVAAQTAADIENRRAAAAQQLMTSGAGLLTGAQQAAAGRAGIAMSPQDAYSKYASIVYGIPQQSTTPNFAGTQGQVQNTSGYGKGIRL